MKLLPATLIAISTVAVLTACAGNTEAPKTAPGYTGEFPAISDGPYATYETVRVFDAPLEPIRRYIEDGNKIVAAMEETDNIKKPVDVVVLSGDWPEVGAVRRLEFSDGHYTLERVLENDFPTSFRYQVWGFTAAAGKNLDYALGQQAWRELPGGRSELTWTYSLRPNAFYKKFFVQRFVENDMRPLMDKALDAVKVQADAAFMDAT